METRVSGKEVVRKGGSDAGFHFMADYLRCQVLFKWKYTEGLVPRFTPRALAFGVSIHEALAAFYSGKPGCVGVFADTYASYKDEMDQLDKFDEDIADGTNLLTEYMNHYNYDFLLDSPIKVLAVEDSVSMPVGHFTFTGRVDMVAEVGGRTVIFDHKTTAWQIPLLERTLRISDQANGYMALWNHKGGPRCNTACYNVLKHGRKPEFQRIVVTRTDDDIARFERKAEYVLKEIALKTGNPKAIWVENTDSCFAYNRACPYYDLCWMSSSKDVVDSLFKREEPNYGVTVPKS